MGTTRASIMTRMDPAATPPGIQRRGRNTEPFRKVPRTPLVVLGASRGRDRMAQTQRGFGAPRLTPHETHHGHREGAAMRAVKAFRIQSPRDLRVRQLLTL